MGFANSLVPRPVLTYTSQLHLSYVQPETFTYLSLTLPTAICRFETCWAATTTRSQDQGLPSANLTPIRRTNAHTLAIFHLTVPLGDLLVVPRHSLPQWAEPLTLLRRQLDVHTEALAHLAALRPDLEDGVRHEPPPRAQIGRAHV